MGPFIFFNVWWTVFHQQEVVVSIVSKGPWLLGTFACDWLGHMTQSAQTLNRSNGGWGGGTHSVARCGLSPVSLGGLVIVMMLLCSPVPLQWRGSPLVVAVASGQLYLWRDEETKSCTLAGESNRSTLKSSQVGMTSFSLQKKIIKIFARFSRSSCLHKKAETKKRKVIWSAMCEGDERPSMIEMGNCKGVQVEYF